MTRFSFLALLSLCLLGGVRCSTAPELKEGQTAAEGLYERAQEELKNENFQIAIELFNELKTKYPYSKHVKDAELGIADAYFQQEAHAEAAVSYQNFVQLFPRDERVPYALLRHGLSFAHQSPEKIPRDQTKAHEAIDIFNQLLSRFPKSKEAEEAKKMRTEMLTKLAAKEDYIGNFYFIRDHYASAALRYERIVAEFPGLGFDEHALYRAGVSHARSDQKEKARTFLTQFVTKFPQHELARDAQEELKGL